MEIAGGDEENISLCANKVHAHSPFCLWSYYEKKFFVREANLVIGQMSFQRCDVTKLITTDPSRRTENISL